MYRKWGDAISQFRVKGDKTTKAMNWQAADQATKMRAPTAFIGRRGA